MNKKTAWRKLSRTERLIEEAKDFRGGSLSGNYLDSRLARQLAYESKRATDLEARLSRYIAGPPEI